MSASINISIKDWLRNWVVKKYLVHCVDIDVFYWYILDYLLDIRYLVLMSQIQNGGECTPWIVFLNVPNMKKKLINQKKKLKLTHCARNLYFYIQNTQRNLKVFLAFYDMKNTIENLKKFIVIYSTKIHLCEFFFRIFEANVRFPTSKLWFSVFSLKNSGKIHKRFFHDYRFITE